jgi:UDP-N-acetylglucosamine 2-epimerase
MRRSYKVSLHNFVKKKARRNSIDDLNWKGNENSKNILFLNFSSRHYKEVFETVGQQLYQTKRINILILELDKRKNVDNKLRLINFRTIWQCCNIQVSSHYSELRKQYKIYSSWILAFRSIEQLISYYDKSLWHALKYDFLWLFLAELPILLQQVIIANNIIDQYKPSLIVSGDDADTQTRIYSLLANIRNIPSLIIQQGLLNEKAVEWDFFSGTVVAAMGENARKALIGHGISENKIIVTGRPQFDLISKINSEQIKKLRETLSGGSDNKIVLLATQPYVVGAFTSEDVRKSMIKAVFQAASSFENVVLLIKPHPDENTSYLMSVSSRFKNTLVLQPHQDTIALIQACNIFITFSSTTALQAMLAEKPIIIVAFPGSNVSNIYIESGATLVATTVQEIIDALKLLINKDCTDVIHEFETARMRFISDWACSSDGRASQRVKEVIVKLLNAPELAT